MSTESVRRSSHNPINRLALALIDILTGVTEASIIHIEGQRIPGYGEHTSGEWKFKVKTVDEDIQDS